MNYQKQHKTNKTNLNVHCFVMCAKAHQCLFFLLPSFNVLMFIHLSTYIHTHTQNLIFFKFLLLLFFENRFCFPFYFFFQICRLFASFFLLLFFCLNFLLCLKSIVYVHICTAHCQFCFLIVLYCLCVCVRVLVCMRILTFCV